MAYQIMQFMCGTDRPQGYVLVGTDEHQGTSAPISVAEMEREATDGARLARFLDYRFLGGSWRADCPRYGNSFRG